MSFRVDDSCLCPRCTDGSGCSNWEPLLNTSGKNEFITSSCATCRLNDSMAPEDCSSCSLVFLKQGEW